MKKEKIQLFIRGLYSVKNITEISKFPFYLFILLFIVIASSSTVPFIAQKLTVNPSSVVQSFPDLDKAFIEIFDKQLPCTTLTDGNLKCEPFEKFTTNGYEVSNDPTITALPEKTSFIIFAGTNTYINYYKDNKDYTLSGVNNLILDYKTIKDNIPANTTKQQYYENLTIAIIGSLYSSYANYVMISASMSSTLMLIIYIIVFGLLIKISNKVSFDTPLTYLECIKIITYIAVGPALLCAFISLLIPSLANIFSMLNTVLFTIRIMLYYYTRLPKKRKN